MNRGKEAAKALRSAGKEGLTKSQMTIILWRMDVPSAVRDARKDWLRRGERIETKMEKEKFLGLFERRQARYTLRRTYRKSKRS